MRRRGRANHARYARCHCGAVGRRPGRATVAFDARSRKTRSSVRRALPNHRHYIVQLRQLRAAPRFRSYTIQSTQFEPARPRRLVRTGRSRRIYRNFAAANARFEGVVSGDRGRGVPEYLFDWQRTLEVRLYSFRRPHLQDELREDAAATYRFRRGRYRWNDPDPHEGSLAAIWRD